jgi:hypothetical protein
MRKIRFYFFCIYNSTYKDGFGLQIYGKVARSVRPEYNAVYAFSIITLLWSICVHLTIISIFALGPGNGVNLIYDFVVFFIVYAICYFYFIDTDRYIDIYSEYKSTDKQLQRRIVKIFAFIMLLPIVLIPLAIILMLK